MAFADRGANEIRIYDQTGKRLITVGRDGQGPGEFQRIRSIAAFAGGDSLLAWDTNSGSVGRFSLFTSDGVLVRTRPPLNLGGYFGGAQEVAGVAVDGTLLIQLTSDAAGWERPSSGYFRVRETYRLIEPTGEPSATFGPVEGPEGFVDASGEDFGFGETRNTEVVLGSHFIYSGDNKVFDIAVSDPRTGRIVRYLRRPYEAVQIPVERLKANGKDTSQERFWDVIQRIVEDTEGNVWVRGGGPPEDPMRVWSVFDPSGAWLGEVSIPTDWSVRAIGRDIIAVVVTGQLGIEYVKVYGIEKTR